MSRIFNTINLLLGLTFLGLVILYATIIIPIALSCLAAFCLFLWIYAHVADGIYRAFHAVRRYWKSLF